MSTFLGFESLLIALGSTNQNVLDQFRTSLTGYGWQCPRKSIYPVATLGNIGTVANAFNQTITDTANSTNALPLWLGCQLGSGFTPTVMYLQTGPTTTYCPTTFTLDYSDNGSTWTTLQTWTSEPTPVKYYERRKYTVSGASSHAYWRINVTAKAGGSYVEISEWILEDASGTWVTNFGFIDVMPPVTETIGNSTAREFLRVSVGGTTIALTPMQELLQPMSHLNAFYGVAGAVTCSITINGVTVSYVGTSGNTVTQNARGLYEACRNSSDANFLAYTWKWINFEYHFVCWKNTPALLATSVMTSTNCNLYNKGGYCAAMPQYIGRNQAYNLTMDLTNGFIYYLQVCSRGLALATKTNAGYYGPAHACYGDNASALVQTPTSIIEGMPCTPIELIVGYDDVSTSTGGFGRTSHWWGSSSGSRNTTGDATDQYSSFNTWTGASLYCNLIDCSNELAPNPTYTVAATLLTMRSEGLFTGVDSGTGYRIHRVVCDPDTVWVYMTSSGIYGRGVAPVYQNLDWYRITGALTDEQLVMVPSPDIFTTITSGVLATDVTINVTSTTGFLSAGYVVVDGEVIQYTGITSTSFTGCTRARYGSPANAHFIGDKINAGAWMVKINTGMLFAGYTKPV